MHFHDMPFPINFLSFDSVASFFSYTVLFAFLTFMLGIFLSRISQILSLPAPPTRSADLGLLGTPGQVCPLPVFICGCNREFIPRGHPQLTCKVCGKTGPNPGGQAINPRQG